MNVIPITPMMWELRLVKQIVEWKAVVLFQVMRVIIVSILFHKPGVEVFGFQVILRFMNQLPVRASVDLLVMLDIPMMREVILVYETVVRFLQQKVITQKPILLRVLEP